MKTNRLLERDIASARVTEQSRAMQKTDIELREKWHSLRDVYEKLEAFSVGWSQDDIYDAQPALDILLRKMEAITDERMVLLFGKNLTKDNK